MSNKIQLRRDTGTNWTRVNPTLSMGEPGFEIDTGKFKIGNGSDSWNSLSYVVGNSSGITVLTAEEIETALGFTPIASTSTLHNGTWTFELSSIGSVVTDGAVLTPWGGLITSDGTNFYLGATAGASVKIGSDNNNEIWTFGTDGVLTLSTASVIQGQGTDPNVYVETFGSGTTSTWTFGTNGVLKLPAATPIIQGSGSGTAVTIIATTGTNTATWVFLPDGNIIFPDTSVQTTAYTGATGPAGFSTTSTLINGSDSFTLNADGSLTLPQGGTITEGTSPAGLGHTITLTPAGGNDSNQQLLIYPTVTEGNHLHLTSGALGTTSIFLGNDNQYVRTRADGAMAIGTSDSQPDTSGLGHRWIFDTSGVLTFPDGTTNSGSTVIAPGNYDIQSIGYTEIQTSANSGAKTWTFGTDGILTVPITASGAGQISGGTNGLELVSNSNTWGFGTDASTTIPGIVNLPYLGQIGSIGGQGYGTEIKNTDGYVGGVQLNWTDTTKLRVDNDGVNITTGGSGPNWHFSDSDGGTLSLPGGINIAGNLTTNNSTPISTIGGAPVIIYTATSVNILAVEIVVRALVDYGGSVELATIHAVKSTANNTANIIVSGQVRQSGGSGNYGDTTYTVSLDGSNFLQVTAQPHGSNDANFIISVTEFN